MTHGRCPACGKKYLLTLGGTIPLHFTNKGLLGRRTCSGTGQPPK